MNHRRLVRLPATAPLCLLTALLVPTAFAAEPSRSDTADRNTTITLSPFEVRTDGDVGYTAASSLAGGRTEAPLKLTSAAISVMTSQFLEDIAATDFRSAAEWSLNWVPQTEADTSVAGGFQINFRNMGNTFASRNYFLWYVESDAYNTERYEFARGPNGVLFGDAGAGGISTTWTKRPRFDRTFRSVNTRVDSYGGFRASLDYNQPVTKDFSLRLNTLFNRGPNWRDYTKNDRHGIHLAGILRLSQRNQFRFEGEFGLVDRTLFPNYYSDQASFWNGTTSYNGVTAPSTSGTGVARISSSNYFLYVPGTPNNGLNDWGTFYQSTGTGLGLLSTAEPRSDIPNSPRLPRKRFNLQPTDSIARLYYYTYSLYIDHRFNENLFVEVAYNRLRNERKSYGTQSLFSTYRIDVNTVLPGGAPNPNYGKAFTDAERIRSLQENIVHDVRALANWRFERSWIRQSVSVIAGSRLDRFDAWGRILRRTNGTEPRLTSAPNQFRERRYWDQAGTALGEIPSIPGVTLDYLVNSINHQRKTLDYTQVASISRFFNDRLSVMLGARRDAVVNSQQTTSGVPTDPVTGLARLGAVIIPEGSRVPVGIVGAKSIGEFSPVSRNIGAVYFVRPWIGVFANYSETFAAPNNGANLIDGRAPGISQSTGHDIGFKLELFGGKVSGSVSRYGSEQADILIGGTRANEINRIWNNLGRAELASIAYRDTQAQKGDGYELDITANPTRALRLSMNLALPETSAVNLQPGLASYFAEHEAAWQAGANDLNNANRAQIATDINTIRNTLSSLTPGTPLNNTFKYTGNIYSTYTFQEGFLRNVSVGAGANVRGRSKIASRVGSPYDYLYANSYTLVSAHATYRHRFKNKLSARFQLNVSNLLDSDDLIYNSFSTFRANGLGTNPLQQVPGTIRIPDPRRVTFSTTLDF